MRVEVQLLFGEFIELGVCVSQYKRIRVTGMQVRVGAIFTLLVLFCSSAFAQVGERFNFSGGAGFTTPVERAGLSLDTGWNFGLRGGLNVSEHFQADLDFTYNHMDLNNATLALFNEPGGSVAVWSLTFNPVLNLAPRSSRVQPYITAGYGLYDRNLTLTRPTTVPSLVCDPFFGFCFPGSVGVNQVVASNSTLKSGFNGGAGFNFRLGERRLKLFAEARYHRMFTTHGADFELVPVTFGFRW
jgi:opacity protein-like surface antigen